MNNWDPRASEGAMKEAKSPEERIADALERIATALEKLSTCVGDEGVATVEITGSVTTYEPEREY